MSECVDHTINGTSSGGYTCRCTTGYDGNPYLSDGCQDINECLLDPNPCKKGKCINLPGTHTCTCDSGYRLNENKTCVKGGKGKSTVLKVSLGISISMFVLLVGIFWLYCGMKRRKFKQLKEMYFKENGGEKLREKLASHKGSVETAARIFTSAELKQATNNYHRDKILGEGAYGTVYKGVLADNKVVAIKKSKIMAKSQTDQFVNEVLVLSQINHRNVVKLLGCCLETEMPLLVYEYVSNGTLYDHVHKRNGKGPLSLRLRLKIAAETAESLAYLHYSTSMQIVHRDVKATNILLDEKFTAKVSDFGASKLVPEDQDQLSTLVQGTMGYLDPEYLQSNTLTEKSDVYSFGVVLVELLTSRRALSLDKPEAERSLANVFVCAVEDGLLKHILDEEVVKDGHFETVEKVADLAKRCLSMKGRERPTMREVARELEGLQILPKHSGGGKPDSSPKQTDYLLASPSNAYVVDVKGEGDVGSITTSIEYDQSMQNQAQVLRPDDAGR
ncbi:putative protein kinase RLK-Pelle-WAK family [Rosa chinensis]|uniref:Protein kinase domain-containing protein n=1 Tax=Rosa chinensis TaxID=74649 RepID=A0A2P6RCS0_ROSCH|nr:wall-associated receptor kinase 3 [Rosa chinensis]PRQ44210.1 putative protein kinase RLK-Pelle-WAK family [Rosa chinensis]